MIPGIRSLSKHCASDMNDVFVYTVLRRQHETYTANSCVVYGTERVDDLFENCDKDLAPNVPIHGYNNRFYTKNANASATCDCCGLRPLAMLPPGLEDNFQALGLPDPATIIAWGREKLFG